LLLNHSGGQYPSLLRFPAGAHYLLPARNLDVI
jgi:hypothetical protein